MAIQYNDITAIGDSFVVRANTPVIGIVSVQGYTDDVLGETATRFFEREFRISTNGITFSGWMDLTNDNLIAVLVTNRDIFDIEYRYTRTGTDTTGLLTFNSISIDGVIQDVAPPKVFTDLYFNKFFNYNDASVLGWGLNVLDKLHRRGIVANYVERGEDTDYQDDDYLALFGAITHFFAIIVRYAREFRDFTENDILLTGYLRQKGLFVSDGMSLADLKLILQDLYVNFLERGTNEIVKPFGQDNRQFDGELLRLIRKGSVDEFIFGLIEKEKTIWNINNNSPLYKGTKGAVNLIKAYEFTQDIGDLASYPVINDTYVTNYEDTAEALPKQVIRVLNVAPSSGTVISGIGDAENEDKLIVIDPRLSYEVTFQVKQPVLDQYIYFNVNLYDKDRVLLTDSPLNAITGSVSGVAIDGGQLNRDDIYYFIRVHLYNKNRVPDAGEVLDIGFGNHLILNNEDAVYMSVELGSRVSSTDGFSGNNELRVWDFKVRPLVENFANGFVMVSSIITAFIENNSEDTNMLVENNIRRYLLPYNTTFKNQFMDELFVDPDIPLQITVVFTNETILGANNGTITITAIGGTPPYTYSINNGVSFQDNGEFTNLPPATYNIVVKDAEDVQAFDTVVIAEGVNNLAFNAFVTDANRPGVNDGIIEVLASGGRQPYYYSIDGSPYSVNNIFTGLVGNATYNIIVRDSDAFEVDQDVTVGLVRDLRTLIIVETNLANTLEGANVRVVQLNENYTTDIDGEAVIYLENGTYTFEASKAGHRTASVTTAITTTGQERNIEVYILYRADFTVRDSATDPIENATIQLISAPVDYGETFTLTTNASGQAFREGLIFGDYTVRVSHPDYQNVDRNFNVFNSDINETIDLLNLEGILVVNVFGRIFGQAPFVLQNATVVLEGDSKVTDVLGEVRYTLLEGTYNGTVSHPEYFFRNISVTTDFSSSNIQTEIVILDKVVNGVVLRLAGIFDDPTQYSVELVGATAKTLFFGSNARVTASPLIGDNYQLIVRDTRPGGDTFNFNRTLSTDNQIVALTI